MRFFLFFFFFLGQLHVIPLYANSGNCEAVHLLRLARNDEYTKQSQKDIFIGKQVFSLGETQLGYVLFMEYGKTQVELGTINVLPIETQVFHWGPVKEQVEILSKGTVEQHSIEDRIGGRDRAGGGFYVSLSPIDSTTFGPRLTSSTFSKNILEVPKKLYDKILFLADIEAMPIENIDNIARMRKNINLLFIKLGIGSVEINTTWKVLLSQSSLTNLSVPSANQVIDVLNTLPPPTPRVLNLFLEKELPPELKSVQTKLRP